MGKYTIKIDIPPPRADGQCNYYCPVNIWDSNACQDAGGFECCIELATIYGEPGLKCPRYDEETKYNRIMRKQK